MNPSSLKEITTLGARSETSVARIAESNVRLALKGLLRVRQSSRLRATPYAAGASQRTSVSQTW